MEELGSMISGLIPLGLLAPNIDSSVPSIVCVG
jgi:hypothetical protein